ncbi:MAG TPA: MFS transporter [Anaerolineae bacterium]
MEPGSPSSTNLLNNAFARFPALSHRNFRLIWFGQMVSFAGTQMQSIAINWQIYLLTSSALFLGLVGISRLVPILIFSMFGGIVADTHDRRKIMFVTQTTMMLSATALGLLTFLHVENPFFILLLTGVTAAASAFDAPARQSLIPNIVPREHLMNAMSLNNMMVQVASIAGPALGGFVIAGLGVSVVYWFNAASFLAVILALAAMRLEGLPQRNRANVNFASLIEGLRFVRHNSMVLSTMLLDFFATFFASANALMPVFARDILHVGAEGLGILYSAESIGALIAGTGVSILGEMRRKGRTLLLAVGVYGLATALYGFSGNFFLSILFLMLVGAGDAVSTILRSTIRQVITPDELRGRMTAANMIFFMGGPQLGNFEAGLLAATIGAPLSVVVGGVATVLFVALVAWQYPQLRRYDA